MPVTYEEAYDLVIARVNTEWPVGSNAIVGRQIEMRYKGVEKALPDDMFARLTMRPVLEGQASFRGGDDNPQRYEAEGLIFVQVFVPKNLPTAEEYSRKLAVVAQRIFRGKTFSGCIRFKNVRINDLEAEETYLRKNVIAEYSYDEIG